MHLDISCSSGRIQLLGGHFQDESRGRVLAGGMNLEVISKSDT